MKGVITTRHLLTQAPVIIKQFGFRCYLRCLRRVLFSTKKDLTFLDCVIR